MIEKRWFIYQVGAINSSWECLPTVARTAERMAGFESSQRTRLTARYLEPTTANVETFLADWESACNEARSYGGWEGDFLYEPAVLWLPKLESAFDYGFVLMQSNNGTVFVVSPIQLSWLDNLVSQPPQEMPKPKKSILGPLFED
ncbi:hypothetical protein RJO15_00020 [Herbaspirillum huttiense F1]|jgi:hypothetical protein|uniref:hypothetical protein n=1 Tax=Herbaspirillum huttiense TaxID=863372 RepID=UPI00106655BA|nr:hypothetical protein [Herbaspirillum huttiense]MDT0354143.1 hypothetical protein [Herbaspirillum huttiense F1]